MGATANPIKSDQKMKIRGNWSVSFFRSDFLQNPYFKIFGQKWDQEVESIYARGVCLNYEQKPCD